MVHSYLDNFIFQPSKMKDKIADLRKTGLLKIIMKKLNKKRTIIIPKKNQLISEGISGPDPVLALADFPEIIHSTCELSKNKLLCRVVKWVENQIVLVAKLRSHFQSQIAIAKICEITIAQSCENCDFLFWNLKITQKPKFCNEWIL